jgi:hypothetical protein
MKRREATGWILKSAIFTPGLASAIQACQQKIEELVDLQMLDQDQYQLCSAIGDTILPKTESVSASEVRVTEIMDLMMSDVFEQEVVDSFIQGLQAFDQECQSAQGKSFAKLSQAQQIEYLTALDQQVMNATYDDAAPFYYTFKKLCVEIYFQTEQGVKQNLVYNPIPGPYVGDVELKTGDKIVVGNAM